MPRWKHCQALPLRYTGCCAEVRPVLIKIRMLSARCNRTYTQKGPSKRMANTLPTAVRVGPKTMEAQDEEKKHSLLTRLFVH